MTVTAHPDHDEQHLRHPLERARAELADLPLGHVIDGVAEPVSADTLPVTNAATGEVVAEVSSGTAADVDRAVAAARKALPGWRGTTLMDRARILLSVADVVEDRVESLAALESLNCGKPLAVSRDEIPGVAEIFRFMAGASRALQAPTTGEYVSGYLSMLRREPLGVVGAITPWNYPLLTASWKIAAALAMGNTVVVKPSELTPLTTLRFMQLVGDVLPPGVVNVVLGAGDPVGAAISGHDGIDMVSLTGSVTSGQRVLSAAVRTLKPSHLELGGKAPVVVFADADLDRVAAGIRRAGFWNSGQECGSGTRIICAATVHDDLVERLVAEAATLRLGAPSEGDEIEMGPLISRSQLDRVAAMVSRARESGATVALGGDPVDRPGFFFPPTIVTGAAPGSEILSEEVFGPVVTLETFDRDEDAVELANNTAYGLAASVWTGNVSRALRLTDALDFGTVWVNDHLMVSVEMPWGGFAASGHGRECSTLGLEDFSRTKHVMVALDAG